MSPAEDATISSLGLFFTNEEVMAAHESRPFSFAHSVITTALIISPYGHDHASDRSSDAHMHYRHMIRATRHGRLSLSPRSNIDARATSYAHYFRFLGWSPLFVVIAQVCGRCLVLNVIEENTGDMPHACTVERMPAALSSSIRSRAAFTPLTSGTSPSRRRSSSVVYMLTHTMSHYAL